MTWMCQCPRELPDRQPVCTACLTDRPTGSAAASGVLPNSCDGCGEPTRLVQLTPGEDGHSRCASCHVEYLRLRAQRDPIDRDDLARCKAELERAYTVADTKWKTHRE